MGYVMVMIVIGKKEKEAFLGQLPGVCNEIRQIYEETKAGNGQKWLLFDLKQHGKQYEDVKKILAIRAAFC